MPHGSLPSAPPALPPTRLVLLGHPVAHSLSPTFQNAALDAAGLDVRYEAVDVAPEALPAMLGALRRSRAAGNVTVPHKAAVAGACDVLTALAHGVGAVNTFWWSDSGALVGDNTDVAGAAATLRLLGARQHLGAAPRLALLGAGGAAAALIVAASETWPAAQVRVWTRRPEHAEALAARFPAACHAAPSAAAALDDATIVVNATPLGLREHDPLPCAVALIPPNAAVFDLVYGARETAWVRAARAAGHVAIDGLPMLVEQGAAAFERWFGRAPDRQRMWAAVEARTGRRAPDGGGA